MDRTESTKKLVAVTDDKLTEGKDSSLSTQVPEKPTRRKFSPEYKLEILKRLEESKGSRGAVGELLRREGLYSAQVAIWKQEVEGELAGVFSKKRGPRPNPAADSEKRADKLEKENLRLREKLRQAEAVIDIQKKLSMILGVDLPPDPREKYSDD